MVESVVKYRLFTKESLVTLENHIGEKYVDYIMDNQFEFEAGKIYGIIGEHGEGGEIISSVMSGRIKTDFTIMRNSVSISFEQIKENGWYVGKKELNSLHREISVKKALKKAIKYSDKYENIEQVIDDFGLKKDLVNYKLSYYSGERMRASLAIGYTMNKKIYCFPWMNSAYLYDIFQSSCVTRFFDRLRNDGCIVIIPTYRKETIINIVDEIVEIDNPRFKNVF